MLVTPSGTAPGSPGGGEIPVGGSIKRTGGSCRSRRILRGEQRCPRHDNNSTPLLDSGWHVARSGQVQKG